MKKHLPFVVLLSTVFLVSCNIGKSEEPEHKADLAVAVTKTPIPTLRVQGRGTTSTKVFPISEKRIAVDCTFSGPYKDQIAIYLVREHQSVNQDGGYPVLLKHGTGSERVALRIKPGNYFFHVISPQATWDLTLIQ